jgi:aryl-alcohol dehydrogenase-like predicted oxidoreductase
MKQRDFGSTGVKVSEIGFGGWSIGERQWGSPPVEESKAAMHAALEAGVTFFDTAQEYGGGKSEEVFGEVLGGREGIFVATKTGKYWEGGKFRTDYSPEHIVASAEGSLKRLKADRIDLYQLHNPGVETSARPETWEALRKLTEQGKIRFYGSSLGSMAELRSAIDGGCAAVQLMVHMADVRELPLLRAAAEAHLAVVCRTPMAWGALSGKYKPGFKLPDSDFRSPGHWGHKTFTKYVERAQQLRFLEGPKQTLGQAAIRYVLAQKGVSVVIPGAKTAEHARQNAAAEAALTDEQLAKIAELQASW